jgi:transposase
MRAYSLDLRERIVRAVAAGRPQSEVARTFRVGRATVRRYLELERATGSLAPRPIPGRPAAIGAAQGPALRAQLGDAPDATLEEHRERWAREMGVRVSVSAMHRAIARLGFTRKKRSSTRASGTP